MGRAHGPPCVGGGDVLRDVTQLGPEGNPRGAATIGGGGGQAAAGLGGRRPGQKGAHRQRSGAGKGGNPPRSSPEAEETRGLAAKVADQRGLRPQDRGLVCAAVARIAKGMAQFHRVEQGINSPNRSLAAVIWKGLDDDE